MNNGLDDVLATETTLSDVDGAAGALIIRGKALEEMVGRLSYEDVLELLLTDFFDNALLGLTSKFRSAVSVPWAFASSVLSVLSSEAFVLGSVLRSAVMAVVSVLRSATSVLSAAFALAPPATIFASSAARVALVTGEAESNVRDSND